MDDNIKINLEKLEFYNNTKNKINFFGDWTQKRHELKNKFISAEPFEHIIIPNFLDPVYAEKLHSDFFFPTSNSSTNCTELENKNVWHKYCNPIEVKYANDHIDKMSPAMQDLFYILSTDEITQKFSEISDIHNLEYDPYLHGAGLHVHPTNGRLNMHLDYEKHPITGKERRLNLILYLSKEWDPKWNGETQLWNETMTECIVKSPVEFNTAFIFKTNDISWHGLPEKITCPAGTHRKSLAYYYVSDMLTRELNDKVGNDGTGYRSKAAFVKRPEDLLIPQMEELYKIRPHRRIEKEDMEKIWPEWTPEL